MTENHINPLSTRYLKHTRIIQKLSFSVLCVFLPLTNKKRSVKTYDSFLLFRSAMKRAFCIQEEYKDQCGFQFSPSQSLLMVFYFLPIMFKPDQISPKCYSDTNDQHVHHRTKFNYFFVQLHL